DFPAVDVTATYNGNFSLGAYSAHSSADAYVGGSPEQYPTEYKAVNSATYLSKNAPQTLIIDPKRDQLVVSQGSTTSLPKPRPRASTSTS
ncbi:MAG: hypothetical protein JWP75_1614, partial [Frondihabitans sp.]|nr:hypothetical protein [Frondihabitans sp.]